MKFSLVIPCFNEGENIPLLIKRLKDIFTFNDMEIILVNNGSTDNTQNIMKNCLSDSSNIKVINIEINKGYGYGILEGLKIITLLSVMIVMMEFTLKIMEYGIGVIIIGEIQSPFQKN